VKGFVLYIDKIEAVKKMDNETAGKIFKALFQYTQSNTVPELDPLTAMLFEFFKSDIDKGKSRHAEISKRRSEAGKKGYQAKLSKAKQMEAKQSTLSKKEKEKEKYNNKKFGGKNV
tara:strand:+ start:84 stop:431 length:348 start_codon:yes stop_codon:yes gene_type:complete